MKKQDIMKVIKETNTNPDIKWSILENTDTKIVLTNSYDKCINFSIQVKHDYLEEWITVRDEHMGCTVSMLMKGDSRWDDYKETEQGIIFAIQHAVHEFNHRY